MDRTLILVKPDAFARNLTGEIIARFERKGLRIAALKHMTMDRAARRAALRRARRQAVLRASSCSFITSGPLVAMVLEGERGRAGRPPGDRRDEPARGRHGLDPRRLRGRGRPEHGPRLRLPGVRRARGEAVLPGDSDPRVAPRRSGGRSSSRPGSRSRSGSPGVEEETRATRRGSRRRTPAARRSRSPRAPATRSSSAPTPTSRSTATSSASRATRPRPARVPRPPRRAARTRWSAGSRSPAAARCSPTRGRAHRGDVPNASTGRPSSGT